MLKTQFIKRFSGLREHKAMIIISIFFLILYSLISLVRHYNFHSNAFDLGIFNQTIYDYSHFKLGPNTIRSVPILLADHFELLLFLFAPLYWVFGTYTLLLIQIFSIIFGAVGIYLFINKETKDKTLVFGAVLLFYLSFGVFEALAFDYHNNVVGSMLLPWLFYYISLKKFRWYYLFLILFLVSKENMPLISAFLGISMLLFGDSRTKKHGLLTFLLSVTYFIVVLKVVIPFFNHGNYDHWSYNAVGSSPSEALKNIILHPLYTLQLFFNNNTKLKTWAILLTSGIVFSFLKPKYGLLLIPVLAQKFLSSEPFYWGHFHQYSIEFAPVIPISIVLVLASMQKINLRNAILGAFIAINLGMLFIIRFYDTTSLSQIFTENYYILPYNRQNLEDAIKLTGNASISTQNSLVPHLADRDKIYFFPTVEKSEYILFNLNDVNSWPSKDKNEFYAEKEKIVDKNPDYRKIYEKENVVLYQKIS